MTPEGKIQSEIKKYLESQDFIVIKMNSGYIRANVKLAPPGTPDLLAIGYGLLFWVEVKQIGGKLRESQIDMGLKLSKRGQKVLVADSLDKVKDYLLELNLER